MEILDIKFKTNQNNDELEIVEYVVGDAIKQRFKNATNENVMKINAKLYYVAISNILRDFKIEYARYISCQHSNSSGSLDDVKDDAFEVKTNLINAKVSKKGNMPKSLDIVMKTNTLCAINLNWVKLARGENIEFDNSLINIPVEFVFGKDDLNKHFKFYFGHKDDSYIENNQYVTLGFQIVK